MDSVHPVLLDVNDVNYPRCPVCGSQWYKFNLLSNRFELQHRQEFHDDKGVF